MIRANQISGGASYIGDTFEPLYCTDVHNLTMPSCGANSVTISPFQNFTPSAGTYVYGVYDEDNNELGTLDITSGTLPSTVINTSGAKLLTIKPKSGPTTSTSMYLSLEVTS